MKAKVMLSEMYKVIGEYLKTHDDAEVISISTHSGSSKYEYTLNLGNPENKDCKVTDKINIERI
jgi:hypothetical protein